MVFLFAKKYFSYFDLCSKNSPLNVQYVFCLLIQLNQNIYQRKDEIPQNVTFDPFIFIRLSFLNGLSQRAGLGRKLKFFGCRFPIRSVFNIHLIVSYGFRMMQQKIMVKISFFLGYQLKSRFLSNLKVITALSMQSTDKMLQNETNPSSVDTFV